MMWDGYRFQHIAVTANKLMFKVMDNSRASIKHPASVICFQHLISNINYRPSCIPQKFYTFTNTLLRKINLYATTSFQGFLGR
jgi:regulator of RNase E activity RraB